MTGQRERFKGFNPRPARVPGDALIARFMATFSASFNPRPARVPGDAMGSPARVVHLHVSIRARHVCRAMHGQNCSRSSGEIVSIRARHVCRAMH